MEELIKVTFEELSFQKLENGVRIIRDKILLAPGVWNGRDYSANEIRKAFERTDWNDKDVISLIADHRDDDKKGRPLTIRDWLGFVSNQRITEEGKLMGDLNLCDSELATKLIDGKAPFGISPFVYGMFDGHAQRDFIFKNFAVVVEPACKESYINDYLEDDGQNEKLEDISISERIQKRKSLSEKSNSTEMKGGKKNMAEEDKIKEKVEDIVKEPKGQNLESIEETEDQILDNIAKMTEKLLAKRKVTPETERMQKLEKEVASLKILVQKLQEEKLEAKKEIESKETSNEKLSAKSRTLESTKLKAENTFTFGGKGPSLGSREMAAMLGYK